MSRTDVHPPLTLAQLLHAQVVDEDGRSLGRVHDVRAVRDDAGDVVGRAPRYRVEGLIVGRRGLRVRLGLRRARSPEPLRPSEPLRWEDVVDVEPGCITVRAGRSTDGS
jgi:hypothetical protein